MNKTISAHIKGIPFIIEENGYAKLENYLQKLKSILGNRQGAADIEEDIEIRIAELLSKKKEQKTVIEESDIDEVLKTLGDPEEYAEDETQKNKNYSNSTQSSQTYEKRLFRDKENGYIGGVCAGLAAYFNIDVTLIRIIWAISFFVFGAGFMLYIILWIILPKATSSIDRLKMQGKPINFDNIKDEVQNAASNISNKAQNFANDIKKNVSIKQSSSYVVDAIRVIGSFVFLAIGISALIGFLIAYWGEPKIYPAITSDGYLSVNDLASLFFNQGDSQFIFWGIFLIVGGFIAFFLFLGFSLLFKWKGKFFKYILGGSVLASCIGIVLCVVVGLKTAKDYTFPTELEEEIAAINLPSLTIVPNAHNKFVSTNQKYQVKLDDNDWQLHLADGLVYSGGIPIQYETSDDSLYHIRILRKAKADGTNKAVKRAEHIQYGAFLQDSTLTLPTYFSFPQSDKIRLQRVTVKIAIPRGKTVKINNHIINLSQPQLEDDDQNAPLQLKQFGELEANGNYDAN